MFLGRPTYGDTVYIVDKYYPNSNPKGIFWSMPYQWNKSTKQMSKGYKFNKDYFLDETLAEIEAANRNMMLT